MAPIFQISKRVDVKFYGIIPGTRLTGLIVERKVAYFASNLRWIFDILIIFKMMAFSLFLNVLMENESGQIWG